MSQEPFSRQKILRADNADIYHTVSSVILSFAALGYTDLASRLLGRLNAHDRLHGQHVVLRPLWFLWDHLGAWPEGEKERVFEEVRNTRTQRNKHGGVGEDQHGDGEPSTKVAKVERSEEGGEERLTNEQFRQHLSDAAEEYRMSWIWYGYNNREDKTGAMTAQEQQTAISAILKAFDDNGKDVRPRTGTYYSSNVMALLVYALDLTIRNSNRKEEGERDHEETISTKPEEILTVVAKRMSEHQQITLLAQCRSAWPLLSCGTLFNLLSLNKSKFETFAALIEDTFTQRFANGRLALEELSIKEILDIINDDTYKDLAASEDEFDPNKGATTLFSEPATMLQIAEKCQDMDLDDGLPEDYEEFLRITNGLGYAFNGIQYEPPLHPIADIRWFPDDEDFYEDYYMELELELVPSIVMHQIVPGYNLVVGRAIELGPQYITFTWLIPPSTVAKYQEMVRGILEDVIEVKGNKEDVKNKIRKGLQSFCGGEEEFWSLRWCCMTWAAGGSPTMKGYPSFKSYLRSVADGRDGEGDEDLLACGEEWWGYMFKEDDGEQGKEKS